MLSPYQTMRSRTCLAVLLAFCTTACGDSTDPGDRDHVWVVDQNGVEVSLTGTWELFSVTHPTSTHSVGDRITFRPDPAPLAFHADGTFTDGDGILWTRVNLTITTELSFLLLERVDTSVEPDRLYVVAKTTADGTFVAEYAQGAFDPPGTDLNVWERQ